ncbi:DNA cytosine methyltransferase [Microbacterium sp. QXD-8]|uniref:DNA (cytosine-5-)-methyltransferase n=1 Tax=Microbacterium psychrotolerans TaxID=3068321 RepID=A0ABU0YYD7_9MICO|nr:DNA cytosine methyltransferase [Microbacterium sp. QXD-8]MDQ7877341.1 DNA cytosine methyltransferase [Microbacterium sp. QXD-8]
MTPRISSDITMSDYYCGAGGSSTGAAETGAVSVVMAVNHWDLAIETHNTNHPHTDHDKADINKADPKRYPRTTIGWFSPECTYWSQARGQKLPDGQLAWDFFGDSLPDEAAERSRMGMWDVPRFAAHHLYDIVIVENVPRVVKGAHWGSWLQSMHDLGYLHEVVWLNSMHATGYGPAAPQSRDRVYVVFWKAGNRRPDFDKWLRPMAHCAVHGLVKSVQVFKPGGSVMKTYGAQYTLRCPYKECQHAEVFPTLVGADSIIDWDLRGIRIGDRKSLGMDDLAEKTMLRIAAGARRYWWPLIVEAAGNTYDGITSGSQYVRAWPTDEPLRTLHTTASKALVVNNVSGSDESRSRPADEPLPSLVAGGNHAALMVPVEGRDGKQARPAERPMRTQSTRSETGLLVPYYSTGTARPTEAPMGTVTSVDREALLVPAGGTWRDKATSAADPMPTRTGSETDALVVPLRNHGVAKAIEEPIDTVAASGNHHALVVRQQNSRGQMTGMSTPVDEPLRTLTAAGNQSLVTPGALTEKVLMDIVMDAEFRMLEPSEIKRGMAFASEYILLGNRREQVKMAGNAVTPNAARDIIAACVESLGIEVAA